MASALAALSKLFSCGGDPSKDPRLATNTQKSVVSAAAGPVKAIPLTAKATYIVGDKIGDINFNLLTAQQKQKIMDAVFPKLAHMNPNFIAINIGKTGSMYNVTLEDHVNKLSDKALFIDSKNEKYKIIEEIIKEMNIR